MEQESKDRWLIDGDCKQCRRASYCQTPCKKFKKRYETMIKNMVDKGMKADEIRIAVAEEMTKG